jgi:anaerobic selenocysteine-containing dehydrogenase
MRPLATIIGGLLAAQQLPRAVLSDHPERLRALFVDSSNPANTAADTREVERALRALELVVVVDVAMTETAQFAHYVLPASTQYEKTEFTLFNFEFPTNYFQVRPAVLPPLPGTLPSLIYTRLARALGPLPGDNALAPLRAAAELARRI